MTKPIGEIIESIRWIIEDLKSYTYDYEFLKEHVKRLEDKVEKLERCLYELDKFFVKY